MAFPCATFRKNLTAEGINKSHLPLQFLACIRLAAVAKQWADGFW